MRISDWSSDVCSSDLDWRPRQTLGSFRSCGKPVVLSAHECPQLSVVDCHAGLARAEPACCRDDACPHPGPVCTGCQATRSEEHTSELQSLMRISYAVFCLKKKKNHNNTSEQKGTE